MKNTPIALYLDGPADSVAERLLGCILERTVHDKTNDRDRVVSMRIVETEAYDQSDIASHSYNGRSNRNDCMFGPSGRLYVYFVYGIHYCCNIVTGKEGEGAAVLIRAVEPIDRASAEHISQNRPGITDKNMTNGPAKLCRALAIDKRLNSHDLTKAPLKLLAQPAIPRTDIIQTTRIGINKGKEALWRFYIKDNPYVSRPAPTRSTIDGQLLTP